MKGRRRIPKPATPKRTARRRRGGPTDDATRPAWPRPVPTMLDLRLNEYYVGAIITGLIASSDREPNKAWARKWSFDMGAELQAEALKRRKRKA